MLQLAYGHHTKWTHLLQGIINYELFRFESNVYGVFSISQVVDKLEMMLMMPNKTEGEKSGTSHAQQA